MSTAPSPVVDTTAESTEPRSGVDRFFEITRRRSTVGAEVRGGVVTFVTMAYIVILNPIILSGGIDVDGSSLGFTQVAAVTALTAGVMTVLFGLVTRLSVHAPAPGLPVLYGRRHDLPAGPLHVHALRVDFDTQDWEDRFLATWPEGSAAHRSYWRRIRQGPDFCVARALGRP